MKQAILSAGTGVRRQMSRWLCVAVLATSVWAVPEVQAQSNLQINTPAVSSLRQAIRARHPELRPLYEAGVIGFAADGSVVLRDASSLPMAQRGQVNALVAAENKDRTALYREIARANGHPEWEADVRATFAKRWIERARPGWWVQQDGQWKAK